MQIDSSFMRFFRRIALMSALFALAPVHAVELPFGFSETVVATNIQNPVGMEVSDDGRIFVLAGNVKRIEIFDDTGFLNEFIRLPQAASLGSGLLGLEFAPDFETSGDVYIAYISAPTEVPGPQKFRVSRFDSDGTIADINSEVVIFEIEDIDPGQQQHQGGDLVIGGDGKIYWALGDRVEGSVVSQPLNSLFGKLLRLNTDGTIPADNPFYADLVGELRAIYANGLRNPFRMEQNKATGEIFMSEVGPRTWEELNRAEAGANYGWPLVAGVVNDPDYVDPVHAYPHDPDGCAIIGGTFYEPLVDQFPSEFHDKFFYGDHCFGWIAYVDLETGVDNRFLTGADRLVEVKVNPVTGALYYLDREYAGDVDNRSGGIGRIDYVGGSVALEITRQPISTTAAVGENVSFNVLVTGESPFSYQWFRNAEALEGETDSSLTQNNLQTIDNGSEFYVEVIDTNGVVVQSEVAVLTISANSAPTVTITLPNPDELYTAGEEVSFAAIATDTEDGDLDASAFHWEIVFHHDDHTHPFIPELRDTTNSSFVPPVNDETAPDVWYRIHLTVTDSAGTSTSVVQDVFPILTNVEANTVPQGLKLLLDGTPQDAPIDFEGVAGVNRVLEAPETQIVDGQTWVFDSWSNGGTRIQNISTPLIDTSYVATYQLEGDQPPVAGLNLSVANSTQITPVVINGVATDDTGVRRVQMVIQDLDTGDYWNGTNFEPGWRRFDVELDIPESSTTPWSYSFSPSNDVEVRVVANARQLDGMTGERESIQFSVIANNSIPSEPSEPSVEITSPMHLSDVANPVLIEGTAELNNLSQVTLNIKQVGALIYWNGTDWQSERTEINANLINGLWTYELDQPVPRDVVVRAFANDGNGNRIRSDRTRINAE